MSNFNPLKLAGRGRETQLQVGKILIRLHSGQNILILTRCAYAELEYIMNYKSYSLS